MHQPFEQLKIGQYLPGCRTHGDYVRAEYAEPSWRVFVGIPTMTQSQLEAFSAGEVLFAPARFGESLFFLLRFGETPWLRAPFEPRAGGGTFSGADPDAEMTFVFVDSDTGVAQGMRAVRLGAAAEQLAASCRNLLDVPYDRGAAMKAQAALVRQYPTGEEMLHAADPADVFVLGAD